MEIVIKIPKDFEGHYALDRFEDSLQRLRRDVYKAMIGNIGVLSDKYEIETLDMLTEAFLGSASLPKGHGRLIDADALMEYCQNDINKTVDCNDIARFPTIIEADKAESEDKG